MAAQPPSLTWKELLNMPPEQGVELLAAQPEAIGKLRAEIVQLSRSETVAANQWFKRHGDEVIGSAVVDVEELAGNLILNLESRQLATAEELAKKSKGPTQKSSNIGDSGSISIDPIEFQSTVDGPVEGTKVAPIEAPPIDIGPLADVVGKAVFLDDLVDLKLKSGGDYFSETVKQTLNNAAHAPEFVTDDGIRVITPYSYLRAAYVDGGNPEEKKGDQTAHDFLAEWVEKWVEGARELNLERGAVSDAPAVEANVAVSADLVALFAHAAIIVQQTHLRQKRVDARHILAAFLLFPQGLQAFVDKGVITALPADPFRYLRDEFLEHILDQATRAENKQAWGNVFSPLDDNSHFDGLRLNQLVTVHYPDYASDTPGTLEGDQLNVADDARALADLICLNDADPPLAVGLFGNWGAGKSTFMQMIEEAIGENTDKVREARRLQQIGRIPFVERVVHIRFNAWHYLDANLWASLVTHIFRELHRQSSEPTEGQDWLSETKVNALIDQLEVVKKVEKEARKELEEIEKSIDDTRKRLAELENEKAEERKSLFGDYVLALSEALPKDEIRAEIDNSVKVLGLGKTVETVKQLNALAEETRTLGGRAKLMLTTAAEGGESARRSMALALMVFLTLGGGSLAAVYFAQSEAVSGFIGEIGLVASVVGGAGAWILPHLKHVNQTLKPIFDAHTQVLKKQEENARAQVAERVKAQEELDKLNAEQVNKERELEVNLLERDRLAEIARGDRPAELLTRFIEDRASAEGYRKHLGLLSHIRRDFETMSKLMREQRQHSEHNISTEVLPRIDRIVLYIDDLDRCRDGQVVEVLEAIHLLLAFDLFVVVVGVDARWLQHSLKEFYDKQLSVAETPEDGKPTVADYLEKIFQVPFHLRPLELGEGGSYGRLMNKLVGEVTASPRRFDDGAPDQDAPPADDDDAKDGKALRTLDLKVPEIEETPEETMQRVMLSDRELEMMRRLGPLVGRSPRAVKRFVNLYRLMRTRRRGADLESFLNAPEGGVTPFRVYLLWLGLETKLTPLQLSNLMAVLSVADLEETIGEAMINSQPMGTLLQSDDKPDGEEEALSARRREFWTSINDVDARHAIYEEVTSASAVTVATLREVIAEVSRYSFRMRGG